MGVEEEVVEMEVEAEGGLQSLSPWESVAKLWVEQDERKKWGRVQHNEHNDKQKNFSVICGRFPLTPPPNSVRQLCAKKGRNKEKNKNLCKSL